MKLHADSHIDHGLTPPQVNHLLERFADRAAFFIETIELPPELGDAPCSLHGPIMGDAPVGDNEVVMRTREARQWLSRMVAREPRRVRTVTVIAGPHDGLPCVMFTAFGGPLAPHEVDDPACRDRDASLRFWSEHALSP